MATIYLIRHGQASFGKTDYDQLSDKGNNQSQLLGQSWQSLSPPDKIYSGDLIRHEQTLAHFLIGYQGIEPSVILHSGFNEFNHVELLTCYDAKWKDFAKISESIGQVADANKVFQKEFVSALKRWVSGEYDHEYKESWSQFKQRCISALHYVIKQQLTTKTTSNNTQQDKDICIFTSGGTISVIIQSILGLSDEKTLEINQQIRNTSVTKVLFSENNISIDYFNNYGHLTSAGADWITFR
jgi:broad specificity phosphatase PhoE